MDSEVAEQAITEQWSPTDHRITEQIEKRVDLVNAPTITANGRPCTPASIRFLFVRFDGGPWQAQVTIYADRPGSLIRTFFSPDKVHQPPQWLTDLIAKATPQE